MIIGHIYNNNNIIIIYLCIHYFILFYFITVTREMETSFAPLFPASVKSYCLTSTIYYIVITYIIIYLL